MYVALCTYWLCLCMVTMQEYKTEWFRIHNLILYAFLSSWRWLTRSYGFNLAMLCCLKGLLLAVKKINVGDPPDRHLPLKYYTRHRHWSGQHTFQTVDASKHHKTDFFPTLQMCSVLQRHCTTSQKRKFHLRHLSLLYTWYKHFVCTCLYSQTNPLLQKW